MYLSITVSMYLSINVSLYLYISLAENLMTVSDAYIPKEQIVIKGCTAINASEYLFLKIVKFKFSYFQAYDKCLEKGWADI